jgi:hypothetical protein
MRGRSFRGALLSAVTLMVALVGWGAPSDALGASPWWHLTSTVRPANIAPGGEGTLVVQATNIGDAATQSPETLSDQLPEGLSIVEAEGAPQVSFLAFAFQQGKIDLGPAGPLSSLSFCTTAAREVNCRTPEIPEAIETAKVNPYEYLELRIKVRARAGSPFEAQNEARIAGGGTPASSLHRPVSISSAPPQFGIEDFSIVPEEAGGAVDVRAGSHPFQLTTTLALNQGADLESPPALARNLQFKLPPGLVGNATAIPQCSDLDFRQMRPGGFANSCPAATAIGAVVITIYEPIIEHLITLQVPLFNLKPARGEPARFGFEIVSSPVTFDTSVRTGSDYGVTVSVQNITELASFISTTVTFWGVPNDPVHDSSRGWGCLAGGFYSASADQPCVPSLQDNPAPFLTLPTSCEGAFEPSVQGISWPSKEAPEGDSFAPVPYALKDSFGRPLGIEGCNQLGFSPSIEAQPDVSSAATPTGLTTRVHVPQEVNENAAGLASSSVKDISVTLPRGVTLNPAGADGLEACSEAQIGFLEALSSPGSLRFASSEPNPFCPNAAKIATVAIHSPLLPEPLEGAAYLATPAPNEEAGSNPFKRLVAMYIVAEDPIAGVLVVLPGEVTLDPTTGQLTARIDDNPQLPFEDAELHFFGGDRAPLSTPAHCGSYTTQATFTPWSGGAPVQSQSTFQVTSGVNGSPCPGTLAFTPSLAGGTTNINAGSFSTLTTSIGREDGQQDIQSVALHMPAGLSGILAGVKLCPEAQANAGTCGSESLIGHTTVSVGLGGDPFSVTGGQVFLTEGYAGAPFGLSIVNPAVAGPFDLGKVVVRAKIAVDPHTAQLTVTTDPSGPYAIPHILDGVPLQIKHVNVTIDRPGFTFNPTSCAPQQIGATIASDEGTSAPVSVPFQVTNCAVLKFAPKFSVSTLGKTSRARGASLTAKLSYPQALQGTQTDIARVKVSLPKALPSRLTTLRQACTDAQFEANPAGCPAGSKIGTASVRTPLLPVPLTGPAIFVSHGGEAFPSLTIVLQGYGVTVDLVGTTFISNAGVTSTTFETVPDVPFQTFTLTLPEGPNSALAANRNLCTSKLSMPTEFLAQNGVKLDRTTPISVTGCARTKTTPRADKLAAALKACRRDRGHARRAGCERRARKRR